MKYILATLLFVFISIVPSANIFAKEKKVEDSKIKIEKVKKEKSEKHDKKISKSGVKGIIKISPTCTVVTYPSTVSCADIPYETTIVFTSADRSIRKEVTSKEDGKFKVRLPAGVYTISKLEPTPVSSPQQSISLSPSPSGQYPLLSTTGPIIVPDKGFIEIEVSFYSGVI